MNKVSYCPYRICPLGAHVDHQLGVVTGFAIDEGVRLDYEVTLDGSVEIVSKNFSGMCKFNVNDLPHRVYDWSDYVVGAVWALNHRKTNENNFATSDIKYGIKGVVEGTLPVGGLSSSAAVIITYLNAFCEANEIELTEAELIKLAIYEERSFIGLNVGKLDQSCEVYCSKDKLLYLDTQDDSYELISPGKGMPEFDIAIIFTGKSRKLISSAYNSRVDECKASAYALKAYAEMEYGKIQDSYLREIPESIYLNNKDRLPLNWQKRVEHFYNENRRVHAGVAAWKNGDLDMFGALMKESGYSSIYLYETGSDELKTMYDIICKAPGVYGGRFSGAGFNGSSIAFIKPEARDDFADFMTREYLAVYPNLRDVFEIRFCKSSINQSTIGFPATSRSGLG